MTKVKENLRLVLNPYALGGIVWQKIGKDLPEPVGAIVNDEARVAEFARKVEKLGFYQKYSLRLWLRRQIDTLENDVPELLTGREERYICKWKQIYTHHLTAIS